MDRWALNAVVLHHRTRFFQAAALAARATAADRDAAASLLGALAWAASPFVAEGEDEQAAMAFSGALAGRMPRAAEGPGASDASTVLDHVERELEARHDRTLDQLARGIEAEGLTDAAPSAVNRYVWRRLFPEVPEGLGFGELVAWLRGVLAEEG